MRYDIAIIGAGFYGCQTALWLAHQGFKVALIEQNNRPGQAASSYNQARIHHGYHYPRSAMTALGSRQYYAQFLADYQPFVVRNFTHLYGIAAQGSHVTTRQFTAFCDRLALPYQPAAAAQMALLSKSHIAAAFVVEEVALDTLGLMHSLYQQALKNNKITWYLGEPCTQLEVHQTDVRVRLTQQTLRARQVLNMTYGGLNTLLTASGLLPLALKTELTELALVQIPHALQGMGITVMDGPFFSTIPFGQDGMATLSHVRYTPHASGTDPTADWYKTLTHYAAQANSHFPYMRNDAARFVPALRETKYVKSHWQVKVVPQKHEHDDGRPILVCPHWGNLGQGGAAVVSVLGAKLDSYYAWQAFLAEAFGAKGTYRKKIA